MMRYFERTVGVAGIAVAIVTMTATTPALAKRLHHRAVAQAENDQAANQGDADEVTPRVGYGYGGYGRSAVIGSGGYGYGYVGATGVPYYFGGPYPYGYYEYPTGYSPIPYGYGYGRGHDFGPGDFGLGSGY